ncbi:serine/threonine-protein kinase [Yinghuangia aomiensis]
MRATSRATASCGSSGPAAWVACTSAAAQAAVPSPSKSSAPNSRTTSASASSSAAKSPPPAGRRRRLDRTRPRRRHRSRPALAGHRLRRRPVRLHRRRPLRPLPEDSVRTLGAGLAEALLTIHGTGLIHRDLKPTNVLLSLDGPRVIDFGISRALDASAHTRTGATVGSPGFMSPEQVDGRDIGPATDVFSLGSVLVFAATGEGPFGSGNGQALMFRIVAKTPELGGVPPGLRNLISACLAKYAGNRPTPQEILDQLAPGGSTEALIAPGWPPGP